MDDDDGGEVAGVIKARSICGAALDEGEDLRTRL